MGHGQFGLLGAHPTAIDVLLHALLVPLLERIGRVVVNFDLELAIP